MLILASQRPLWYDLRALARGRYRWRIDNDGIGIRRGDIVDRKTTLVGSWIVLIALCAGFAETRPASGAASGAITLESLLDEMVDRDSIARLPSSVV